ncbi:MAG: hypothetical protein HYZ54_02630 [Ignavibacteriae bacterium]|nr:hypothetical protein [Ignavibacteriota bacterium]
MNLMRLTSNLLFIFCIIISLVSCNAGLEPNNSHSPIGKTYLSGTITYKGGKDNWKFAKDSIVSIRVVAFKHYPDSSGILNDILSGNAFFTTESLPFFVDSSSYSIEIAALRVELLYIGVAQQYGADLTKQQRVIGLYTLSGDNTKPSSITVEKDKINRADIFVDFENLPPQPF